MCKITKNLPIQRGFSEFIYYVHIPDPIIKLLVSINT